MLKTNSKKALENIRAYIVDNYSPENEGAVETTDFETVAKEIYKSFFDAMHNNFDWNRVPESVIFADWCAGLPSILDTCYWYNRSATEDLGNILEETEAEKEKYSDSDACELLTSLLYREIKKNAEV